MTAAIRDAPIVVTMTSLPSRIERTEATLRSLLEQSRPPDRMLLALPERSRREGTGYEVPAFLRHGELAERVEIVRSDDDYGPGTKLLGCLPAIEQPSIVVLADDDVAYHRCFIEDLVAAQRADARSANSYYTYRSRGLDIGQGCDGFSMWSPAVEDLRAWIEPHLADRAVFHQDDVWISFFLARSGVAVRSVALRPEMGELVYEQLYEINPLQYLTGDLERRSVTVRAVDRLMRKGDPTRRMLAAWQLARLADGLGVPRAKRVARRTAGRLTTRIARDERPAPPR